MAEFDLGQVAFFDKGLFSLSEIYKKWDFVTTTDSTYLCVSDTPIIGKEVTNTTYWKCIADGKPATLAAALAVEKAGYAQEQGELAQTAREGIEEDLAAKIDKSSITSELGDSEELVVSQKGVSDEIKIPVESGEQAAAAALVELKKEVAYLKKVLNNVITYLQINTLSVDSLQIKGAPLFIFSDVVPAVVPDFTGQIYIKTTATAAAWIALGDSSAANWKEV